MKKKMSFRTALPTKNREVMMRIWSAIILTTLPLGITEYMVTTGHGATLTEPREAQKLSVQVGASLGKDTTSTRPPQALDSPVEENPRYPNLQRELAYAYRDESVQRSSGIPAAIVQDPEFMIPLLKQFHPPAYQQPYRQWLVDVNRNTQAILQRLKDRAQTDQQTRLAELLRPFTGNEEKFAAYFSTIIGPEEQRLHASIGHPLPGEAPQRPAAFQTQVPTLRPGLKEARHGPAPQPLGLVQVNPAIPPKDETSIDLLEEYIKNELSQLPVRTGGGAILQVAYRAKYILKVMTRANNTSSEQHTPQELVQLCLEFPEAVKDYLDQIFSLAALHDQPPYLNIKENYVMAQRFPIQASIGQALQTIATKAQQRVVMATMKAPIRPSLMTKEPEPDAARPAPDSTQVPSHLATYAARPKVSESGDSQSQASYYAGYELPRFPPIFDSTVAATTDPRGILKAISGLNPNGFPRPTKRNVYILIHKLQDFIEYAKEKDPQITWKRLMLAALQPVTKEFAGIVEKIPHLEAFYRNTRAAVGDQGMLEQTIEAELRLLQASAAPIPSKLEPAPSPPQKLYGISQDLGEFERRLLHSVAVADAITFQKGIDKKLLRPQDPIDEQNIVSVCFILRPQVVKDATRKLTGHTGNSIQAIVKMYQENPEFAQDLTRILDETYESGIPHSFTILKALLKGHTFAQIIERTEKHIPFLDGKVVVAQFPEVLEPEELGRLKTSLDLPPGATNQQVVDALQARYDSNSPIILEGFHELARKYNDLTHLLDPQNRDIKYRTDRERIGEEFGELQFQAPAVAGPAPSPGLRPVPPGTPQPLEEVSHRLLLRPNMVIQPPQFIAVLHSLYPKKVRAAIEAAEPAALANDPNIYTLGEEIVSDQRRLEPFLQNLHPSARILYWRMLAAPPTIEEIKELSSSKKSKFTPVEHLADLCYSLTTQQRERTIRQLGLPSLVSTADIAVRLLRAIRMRERLDIFDDPKVRETYKAGLTAGRSTSSLEAMEFSQSTPKELPFNGPPPGQDKYAGPTGIPVPHWQEDKLTPKINLATLVQAGILKLDEPLPPEMAYALFYVMYPEQAIQHAKETKVIHGSGPSFPLLSTFSLPEISRQVHKYPNYRLALSPELQAALKFLIENPYKETPQQILARFTSGVPITTEAENWEIFKTKLSKDDPKKFNKLKADLGFTRYDTPGTSANRLMITWALGKIPPGLYDISDEAKWQESSCYAPTNPLIIMSAPPANSGTRYRPASLLQLPDHPEHNEHAALFRAMDARTYQQFKALLSQDQIFIAESFDMRKSLAEAKIDLDTPVPPELALFAFQGILPQKDEHLAINEKYRKLPLTVASVALQQNPEDEKQFAKQLTRDSSLWYAYIKEHRPTFAEISQLDPKNYPPKLTIPVCVAFMAQAPKSVKEHVAKSLGLQGRVDETKFLAAIKPHLAQGKTPPGLASFGATEIHQVITDRMPPDSLVPHGLPGQSLTSLLDEKISASNVFWACGKYPLDPLEEKDIPTIVFRVEKALELPVLRKIHPGVEAQDLMALHQQVAPDIYIKHKGHSPGAKVIIEALRALIGKPIAQVLMEIGASNPHPLPLEARLKILLNSLSKVEEQQIQQRIQELKTAFPQQLSDAKAGLFALKSKCEQLKRQIEIQKSGATATQPETGMKPRFTLQQQFESVSNQFRDMTEKVKQREEFNAVIQAYKPTTRGIHSIFSCIAKLTEPALFDPLCPHSVCDRYYQIMHAGLETPVTDASDATRRRGLGSGERLIFGGFREQRRSIE
jgi:hypothetical protein